MKKIKLPPCPFCGREAEMEEWHGGGPEKVRVGCPADSYEECGVCPGTTGNTPAIAALKWKAVSSLLLKKGTQVAISGELTNRPYNAA